MLGALPPARPPPAPAAGPLSPIVEPEPVQVTQQDLEPDLTLTDPDDFEMPDVPFDTPESARRDPGAGSSAADGPRNESR